MIEHEGAEETRRKILSLKGTEKGLNLIIESFKDKSWRVRKTALESLLQSYPPETFIDKLIELLYLEDNAGARNTAIEALIRTGKKAIPYLIKAFETENHDVRKFIVDILGNIGGKETIPLLLRAINDEDDNVRASAVEYLGKMKEDSVVEALIDKVASADTWVAYPAIDALGKLGDPRAVPVLIEALQNRSLTEPAVRALSMIAEPETLEHIVPFLKDKRRSIQEEVIKAIERFYKKGVAGEYIKDTLEKHLQDEAVDIILKHSESKVNEVKTSAIVLLGILQDRRAIRYLVEISEDERFRDVVKESLSYLARHYPEVVSEYLRKGFPETRRVVAEVIAQLRAPVFYKPLMEVLEDTDGHVISIAARGLGYIGNKETVEKLLPLLRHPYPDVQESVVDALYNLREYLDMERMREMLKDEDGNIRKNTVLLFGKCKKTEFIEPIGELLNDPLVEVRKVVVLALGMIDTPKATDYLKSALTDESREIRALATERLAEIGGSVFAESVVLMTRDHDPYVRAAAARALSHFTDDASVQALIDLLSDENGYVVTQAVESLAKTGHAEAKEALIELLQNTKDREIKRTTLLALSTFESSEDLIKPFLLSDDWVLRFSAVKALQKIGTESAKAAIRQLKEIETDITVLEAIMEGLGE